MFRHWECQIWSLSSVLTISQQSSLVLLYVPSLGVPDLVIEFSTYNQSTEFTSAALGPVTGSARSDLVIEFSTYNQSTEFTSVLYVPSLGVPDLVIEFSTTISRVIPKRIQHP
ncbi:hypothetical protein J6590_039444 [Homalodisca vitripennis]|nr:hypothetical protein J6590_039444 [Homalodisca vitripennis]